jgi:hypothetical protein
MQADHCQPLPDKLEIYPGKCADVYKGAMTAVGDPVHTGKAGVGDPVHTPAPVESSESNDRTFGTAVRVRLRHFLSAALQMLHAMLD